MVQESIIICVYIYIYIIVHKWSEFQNHDISWQMKIWPHVLSPGGIVTRGIIPMASMLKQWQENMGVSQNGGTPESSSILDWDVPLSMNHPAIKGYPHDYGIPKTWFPAMVEAPSFHTCSASSVVVFSAAKAHCAALELVAPQYAATHPRRLGGSGSGLTGSPKSPRQLHSGIFMGIRHALLHVWRFQQMGGPKNGWFCKNSCSKTPCHI